MDADQASKSRRRLRRRISRLRERAPVGAPGAPPRAHFSCRVGRAIGTLHMGL